MTTHAVRAGRQVTRRLAHRRAAVVARCAVSDDPGMVESCSSPGDRVVARPAVTRGGEVPSRLGGGRDAVVARNAEAAYVAVIEAVRMPRSCGMAIVAVGTRGNVCGRLARLRARPCRGVTDRARTGRRLEISTSVALLAAQDRVAAREREASLEVIEAFRPGRLRDRGA